ncbi:ABC transporter I family member 11, chloroplastic isoform X6 [Amborella trichopoda]|uniref:ABC transporter I family member 11, chloroplastic isoform X6 n=1 Tax=Amborella trichopoda TaxID=13333 RepID=UPI0009BD8C0E|nr:ABC transporter I family member 11, chloroplastic isoform X6 [Amborella trichopoda]|eukprot:XP_020517933.1 ABC transporter I family member 11, chloroplastic isoform X6 [Amborella trichopoda]
MGVVLETVYLFGRKFKVKDVNYRPPGTQHNLLNEVSLSLPEKSLGLIYGRSGSGKTTHLQKYGNDGQPNQPPETLSSKKVGIVFQFSERYFLTDTVLEDVIFGWPKHSGGLPLRQQLASRLQTAIHSVRMPDLLLLDEPLAGLGDPNSFHSDLHEASQALQQWHEG